MSISNRPLSKSNVTRSNSLSENQRSHLQNHRSASSRSRPGIMGWEEIVLLGFLRHTQLELTGMLDFLRARHLPPPPPRPDQLHRLARDAAECAHNLLEYEPERKY